jgi:chloramphenicol O-acetyltransferase type B
MNNPFKHYRESVLIKDNIVSKHIIAGEGSYYAGYYHRKSFEECVLYLDEIDNKLDSSKLDKLVIGKYCSIASGAQFMLCGTQGHNYDWIAVHPLVGIGGDGFPGHKWKGDTVIGNDVWLGFECLIMPGIKISDGAVIAAKSVITKNIGPYEIWGGNPAKLIKKRFSDEDIEKILEIKWWDWNKEMLARNISYLRSSNVKILWEKYKNNSL